MQCLKAAVLPGPSRRGAPGLWSQARTAVALAAALAMLALGPAAARADVTILAFGDFLTAGAGLPEAQGFVPQLEAWLHAHGAPDVTVINAGVSGDTSAGGLARIDWALTARGRRGDRRARRQRHAARPFDGQDARQSRRHPDPIDAKGLPALLAGLPAPPNYPKDYQRDFKAAFQDLAARHDAIYVSSFFGGMSGKGMQQVLAMMQPDGIHPNAAGVVANVAASARRCWSSSSARGPGRRGRDPRLRRARAAGAGAPGADDRRAGPAGAAAAAAREPAPDAGLPRRRAAADARGRRRRLRPGPPPALCARARRHGPLRRREGPRRLRRRRRESLRSATCRRGRDRRPQRRRRARRPPLRAACDARAASRAPRRARAGGGSVGGTRRLPRAPVRGRGLPPLSLAPRRQRGRSTRSWCATAVASGRAAGGARHPASPRATPMSRSRWSSRREKWTAARCRASAFTSAWIRPRTVRRGRKVRAGRRTDVVDIAVSIRDA